MDVSRLERSHFSDSGGQLSRISCLTLKRLVPFGSHRKDSFMFLQRMLTPVFYATVMNYLCSITQYDANMEKSRTATPNPQYHDAPRANMDGCTLPHQDRRGIGASSEQRCITSTRPLITQCSSTTAIFPAMQSMQPLIYCDVSLDCCDGLAELSGM